MSKDRIEHFHFADMADDLTEEELARVTEQMSPPPSRIAHRPEVVSRGRRWD